MAGRPGKRRLKQQGPRLHVFDPTRQCLYARELPRHRVLDRSKLRSYQRHLDCLQESDHLPLARLSLHWIPRADQDSLGKVSSAEANPVSRKMTAAHIREHGPTDSADVLFLESTRFYQLLRTN